MMKQHFPSLAGLISVISLLTTVAWAQKPTTPHAFELQSQSTPRAEVEQLQGRFDAEDGHALVLYDRRDATQGSAPRERALNWVGSHLSLLGLTPETAAGLTIKHIRNSDAGSTVRFSQSHLGLPVHRAELVINLDKQGAVRYVTNSTLRNFPAALPSAPLGTLEARDAIINRVGLQGPLQFDQSFHAWTEWNGLPKRVVVVKLVGAEPIGDFEAILDAQSGQILSLLDLSCSHHDHVASSNTSVVDAGFPECSAYLPPAITATGTGFVYDADPLSQARVAYAGAYVDGSDATNASLDAARVSKTLNDITFNGTVYSLEGPYAAIREFENPNRGLFAQASSTFNFNRLADNFEGVNTYYFLDMSMRYLNLTLGVSVMPYQYTTGVQFDAHGLNGADNSHYVGSTGRLAFGEGGVDDAEDSDVILHELGHGLHDWITVGGLSNVQGLSEGTGDYWTQSHSRSLGQWTTAQAAYHWVFNWDGHNPFWGGRITNYGAAYPGGLTGAIHTDGQIWSTCLMRIYDAIGRAPTDKALWEGLAMTGGTTNQRDAAIAVRQAAINMGYTSTQINTISTLLSGCGYVLPVILPVEIQEWTAVRNDPSHVQLNWTALEDANLSGYAVERKRSDEVDFSEVAWISNVSGGNYHITDANQDRGLSLYRLRYFDTDGQEHHSEVRTVAGEGVKGLEVSLMPNPSEGNPQISVVLPGATSGEVKVTLRDLRGQSLHVQSFQVSGQSKVLPQWDARLASGAYLVEVSGSDGSMTTLRWMKR
jgi:hypothetical protein